MLTKEQKDHILSLLTPKVSRAELEAVHSALSFPTTVALTEKEQDMLDKLEAKVIGQQCAYCTSGTNEDDDECRICDGMGWISEYDFTDPFATERDIKWLIRHLRVITEKKGGVQE